MISSLDWKYIHTLIFSTLGYKAKMGQTQLYFLLGELWFTLVYDYQPVHKKIYESTNSYWLSTHHETNSL